MDIVNKVIISDKVYLPRKIFDELSLSHQGEIEASLKKVIIDPSFCPIFSVSAPCPKLAKQGKRACFSCKFARRVIRLYRKTPNRFIFERGNIVLVAEILKEIGDCYYFLQGKELAIVDKRVYFKLPVSMQFNVHYSKLEEPRKTEQIKVCKEWLEKKFGQIVCPARFGKTVVAAILASRSKTRVAIVIHQKELIDQFAATFMRFTDIREKGKIFGHRLIAINPGPGEVDKLSICLYTWQQFISKKGKERLREVRDKFGFVINDEVHKVSAEKYSEVISRFKARYRCGVTATPTRRDGLEIRHNLIIGPPTVYGGAEQLRCKYSIVHTGWVMPHYKKMNNLTWNYLWGRLSNDKERNRVIIKYAKKDMKKGHKIIIPVKRVAHARYLTEALEKETNFNIVCFIASVHNREKVAKDIRKGKYQCVVATRQLVSLGFDAPPMSALYLVVPSFDSSNLYQEYSRIRTVHPGKKKPLIRVFVDEDGISYAFKNKVEKEMKERKFKEV